MSVKSSDNVFDVLDFLTHSTSPVSGAEIASALQIPMTSMSRALATLEAAGYAQRTSGQARFELGSAGQMLVYAYMSQFPVRNAALPYLQQLTSISGHSCALFHRVGHYAVRIAFIAGSGAIINMSALGEARGLEDGAAGWAFWAYDDHASKAAKVGAVDWGSRASEIREQGFARSPSFHEQGGHDLAFPLFATGVRSPAAAVMLEGISADTPATVIDEWRGVIEPLQVAILGDQTLQRHPYAHLNPESIDLDLCRVVDPHTSDQSVGGHAAGQTSAMDSV